MPFGEWLIWVLLGGRGSGKTRGGAEWIRDRVGNLGARSIALLGATAADARDVMIEGPSGILSVFPDNIKPIYEPSKRKITFHTGAIAKVYSGEKPDQIRGGNFDTFWGDEYIKWPYPEDALDNALLATRLGDPRALITTTPKPTKALRELLKDEQTVITRTSTYENEANLADSFFKRVVKRYLGTRIERQELRGELIEEVEGALWRWNYFRYAKHKHAKFGMDRLNVAIDPSGSKRGDEVGITAQGKLKDRYFVLADKSGHMDPEEWAETAINLHDRLKADKIVAEQNFGGGMVESVIKQKAETMFLKDQRKTKEIAVELVTASRGKKVRAEPVSMVYKDGRVWHVGHFPEMEEELTTWTPEDDLSPGRLDAMVWGMTDLMENEEREGFFYLG